MKRTYEYKEIVSRLHYIQHYINIQDGDPEGGWYRQLTSIEAFVNRLLDRWHNKFYLKCKHKNVEIRFRRWEPDTLHTISFYKSLGCTVLHEKVYHNSVWDFYRYIGFDHKNKTMKHLDQFLFEITN
jgi:hypothetical protein